MHLKCNAGRLAGSSPATRTMNIKCEMEFSLLVVPLYCNPEYKVSSDGYIISKRLGKPMKPSKSPRGYLITNIIMPDGSVKGISIHGAVAKSFLGDHTDEGLQINHIDGNKENNCLDNLEWVTRQENMRHAIDQLGVNMGANNGNAKAIYGCDKKTNEIVYAYDSISDCARAIAKPGQNYIQVKNNIWRVLAGLRKSFRGCVWKYQTA